MFFDRSLSTVAEATRLVDKSTGIGEQRSRGAEEQGSRGE